jgi:hypothetical protein
MYALPMPAQLGLWLLPLLASLPGGDAAPARSDDAGLVPDCVDAEILGSVKRQTPVDVGASVDFIVTRWPWIVDMDVDRVLKGRAPPGRLRVQTFQHTYYTTGPHRWWLRRNTLGGFNMYTATETGGARLCDPDAPPLRPFVEPGAGKTLDDLQREGEARYGRGPGN